MLIERTVTALAEDGIDATLYEWLTPDQVWCTFRVRGGNVVAESGRVGRMYHLELPYEREVRTYDLADALELIWKSWRGSHAGSAALKRAR